MVVFSVIGRALSVVITAVLVRPVAFLEDLIESIELLSIIVCVTIDGWLGFSCLRRLKVFIDSRYRG